MKRVIWHNFAIWAKFFNIKQKNLASLLTLGDVWTNVYFHLGKNFLTFVNIGQQLPKFGRNLIRPGAICSKTSGHTGLGEDD